MPRRKSPRPPTLAEVRERLAGYRGLWASLTPEEREALRELPEWHGKAPSEPQEPIISPGAPHRPSDTMNGPPEGSEPHPPDCRHPNCQRRAGGAKT